MAAASDDELVELKVRMRRGDRTLLKDALARARAGPLAPYMVRATFAQARRDGLLPDER